MKSILKPMFNCLFLWWLTLPFVFSQTNYTVGGENPDFSTLVEVSTFLANTTLTETVIFNLRSGEYNEGLYLTEVAGASETNQIIFQSETQNRSDVTIGNRIRIVAGTTEEDLQQDLLFELDGTDYVTFRHLTLKGRIGDTETTDKVAVLRGFNGVEFLTIENCAVSYSDELTRHIPTYLILLDDELEMGENRIQITNSTFERTENAILIAHQSADITIQNNEFTQHLKQAIQLSNNTSADISNNIFVYVNNGIEIENNGSIRIESNEFNVLRSALEINGNDEVEIYSNTINSAFNAMHLYSNGTTEIFNNEIAIENDAIRLESSDVLYPNTWSIIANNFIEKESEDEEGTIIALVNALNTQIYHNTLNAYQYGEQSNDIERGIAISGGRNIDLKNNSVNQFYGGTLLSIHNVENFASDYNNLYTTAEELAISLDNELISLTDYISSTPQETHSVSVNPNYQLDSLLPHAAALNNHGIFLAQVPQDIRENNRNQLPDIGALEFDGLSFDLEISNLISPQFPLTAGLQEVAITVINNSNTTVDDSGIDWEINGVSQPTYTHDQSLAAGDTVVMTIGTFETENGQGYDLLIYPAFAENMRDENSLNDTLRIENNRSLMSGTYVIGTSESADFADPQEAFDALVSAGIGGHVTINVEDGFYEGTFLLSSFPRISEGATVTFQSASGDAEQVIWNLKSRLRPHEGGVTLQAIDNVAFHNMTFQAHVDSCNALLILQDGGSQLEFSGIQFKWEDPETFYTSQSVDFNSGQFGDVAIVGCNFKNGSLGIGGNKVDRLRIENNTFSNWLAGMEIFDVSNVTIQNNIINFEYPYEDRNFVSFNYSIFISGYTGHLSIENNQCYALGHSAVVVTTNEETALTRIANNLFISESLDFGRADGTVLLGQIQQLDFIHNTIISKNQVTNQAALRVGADIAQHRILNNIIHSTGNGRLLQFNYGVDAGSQIDYNNHSSNGVFGQYNDDPVSTFAEWQNITGYETNSITTTPIFLQPNSYLTEDENLKGAGIFVDGYEQDIEGRRRGQNPSIGAYEIDDNPALIGPRIVISELSTPDVPFAAGVYDLNLTFTNSGDESLQSADFQYFINGILQPIVNYTGDLAPNASGTLVLSDINFAALTEHTIEVIAMNYNGNSNNIQSDIFSKENIAPALGGEYIVGGNFQQFATPLAANEYLQRHGAIAPVNFNIEFGIYNEALHCKAAPGVSSERPITFQSADADSSRVTLRPLEYTLAVVLLDNASHYTFRHLTIATDSTSYGVKFSNNSTNNIIENCDFQEGRPNVTFVHIENTDNTTNQGIVRNNTFFGGADAIILRGTAQNPSSGSQIINNYLNFHTFRGIVVDTAKDAYIADNVITRSMEGLMITNSAGVLAERNYFYTGERMQAALQIEGYLLGENSDNILVNNYLEVNSNISDNIILRDVSHFQMLHNTAYVRDIDPNFGQTRYLLNLRGGGEKVVIKNNIFVNEKGFINCFTNPPADLILDNNVYFSGAYDFGNFNNVVVRDFVAWQTASDQDANSGFVDPMLHPEFTFMSTNQVVRTFTATDLDYPVVTDLFQQDRDLNEPMAGCYETERENLDIGITALTSHPDPKNTNQELITVTVSNLGVATIDYLTINWQANGVAQIPVKSNKQLATRSGIELKLGVFDKSNDLTLSGEVISRNHDDAFPDNNTFLLSRMGLHIPYTDLRKITQSSKNTDLALQFFPNPAENSTIIQFELSQPSEVQIYILNALGQPIQTTTFLDEHTSGIHQYPLNVSSLGAGWYQVVVETLKGMERKALVVQR